MTGLDTALLVNLGAVLALSIAGWAVSLRLRNASVVDVGWGLGCVLVAWLSFALTDGAPARRVLVVALTTIWGLRLSAHLARRIAREGEDFRHRELRGRYGRRFPLLSLFTVFGFQGLGIWTVTLPVQAAVAADSPATLTLLDGVGVAVFAIGLFFEVVGDLQLARFRADPRNRGQVLDRGLWRYTRHPNYFGDFCVWWGLYAIALATGEAWWTVIGPLVMSYVLLRVSGVRAMEAHLSEGREGYAEYVRRTPAFFPLPRSRKPTTV